MMNRCRAIFVGMGLVVLWIVSAAQGQAVPRSAAKGQAAAGVMARIPPVVFSDIPYVQGGGALQTLDLYLPGHGRGPFPLIIWIHGGSWQFGSKADGAPVQFASEGYAVASINYRLVPRAIFPAQIQDCKAAVRFLRANAALHHLDPQRFAAWGYSAGGQLAGLLGASAGVRALEGKGGNLHTSSAVQLVVDWSGPSDFLSMQAQSPAGDTLDHNAASSAESLYIGAPLQQDPARTAAASPVTYIHAVMPPFLIMQGDQDQVVPYAQSVEFQHLLRKSRVNATIVPIMGAGHSFDMGAQYPTVKSFLDAHFKPGK